MTNALTAYRVRVEVLRPPGVTIPAMSLLLGEARSGGWSGTVNVAPRIGSSERAFRTLMADGLIPGAPVVVRLEIGGTNRYRGIQVRHWPSVITSVNTTRWGISSRGRDAFCAITFRDPLSQIRHRTIWTAFTGRSVGEIVGGVLSAAAGGDGRPTRTPVLPGLPVTVRIRDRLRPEIRNIPYAIAAGEPLAYWLSRVLGRLGVRIEMWGDRTGGLHVALCDAKPSETDLNRDGGVAMMADPRGEASATNLVICGPAAWPPLSARGGLLDIPSAGEARRFGRAGPVETVVVAAETAAEEAERRGGFPRSSRNLALVRMTMISRQPALLPGRVVRLDRGLARPLEGEERQEGNEGPRVGPHRFTSLFGARKWQAADVSHLFMAGRYWNRVEFEKTGAAWRPAVPSGEGAPIVSGVVDDGDSAPGELVHRDRLGRIPIRFSFVAAAEEAGESSSSGNGDASRPPLVPLAMVGPFAGGLHGFVSAHRQGDWCRVAVINPLFAEIVGFGYRDDRYLGANVRDATMGIVIRQGREDWRGMLFRPDEDLPRELADAGSRGDDSGS